MFSNTPKAAPLQRKTSESRQDVFGLIFFPKLEEYFAPCKA